MPASTSTSTEPQVVTKILELKFDDIGYPNWKAELWLNPPAFIYEDLIAIREEDSGRKDDNGRPIVLRSSDDSRNLKGLAEIVLSWNFLDYKGNKVPLPKEWKDASDVSILPNDLWKSLLGRYFDEFNKPTVLPKASTEKSEDTSQTNGTH